RLGVVDRLREAGDVGVDVLRNRLELLHRRKIRLGGLRGVGVLLSAAARDEGKRGNDETENEESSTHGRCPFVGTPAPSQGACLRERLDFSAGLGARGPNAGSRLGPERLYVRA